MAFDKNTLEWLERRKVGMCCRCVHYYTDITDCGIGCQWIANKDFPMLQCFRFRHEDYTIEKGNYEDAAEFEARVALKCARLTFGELPCGAGDCADEHMFSLYGGCDGCVIRAARLKVEEEMEREGK